MGPPGRRPGQPQRRRSRPPLPESRRAHRNPAVPLPAARSSSSSTTCRCRSRACGARRTHSGRSSTRRSRRPTAWRWCARRAAAACCSSSPATGRSSISSSTRCGSTRASSSATTGRTSRKSSAARLAAAVQRDHRRRAAAVTRDLAGDTRWSNEDNRLAERAFGSGAIGTLQAVVAGLRSAPGRKGVLFFSDGFSLSGPHGREDGAAARAVAQSAGRSGDTVAHGDLQRSTCGRGSS